MTGVAPSAVDGFRERVTRLYEEDAPPEEIGGASGNTFGVWIQWVVSRGWGPPAPLRMTA